MRVCFLPLVLTIGIVLLGVAVQPVPARVSPEVQATLDQMQKFSEAFAAVAAEVQPGVVAIVNKKNVRVRVRRPVNDPVFDYFFRAPQFRQEQQQQSLGSGVIVSAEGYILTNHHVIAEADEIQVDLTDGRVFEARVVGTDPQSDVAVLKIAGENLPTVPFGNSDALRVGEWVLAIGNPFGLRHTVTYGIVSALGRGNLDLLDYEDFIQTDAAINPGNSGGAMVNLQGELVGINTAIFSHSGGYQGVGFAIPVNMARSLMRQIVDSGEVTRGFLDVAVEDLTPQIAAALGLNVQKGVVVLGVDAGGIAEGAGLRRGDVIVEMNGRRVAQADELRTRIAQATPGSEARLKVIQGGRTQTLRVTLGGLNRRMAQADAVAKREASMGIEVQELTPELARRLGYSAEAGALLTNVRPGSPAYRSRLRRGDLILEVNNQEIRDLNDYMDALGSVQKGDTLVLLVRREYRNFYRTFYITLRVPE